MNPCFAELCRGISREFNAQDVEQLVIDGYIHAEGVGFGLVLDDEDAPQRITFRVDLGPLNAESRLAMLEEALAINLDSDDSTHGLIGLDRHSDHLVLMRSFDYLADMDLQAVVAAMRRLAAFSKEFQGAIREMCEPEGLAGLDAHAVFG